MPQPRVRADFNGVFGELLCLSHSDTCVDETGALVELRPGLVLTAFEDNEEAGRPDKLLATGVVEPSPEWLQCTGSRWVLRMDGRRVYHESDSPG
jgi:hypothetical protein